jgi:lipoyl-dependent peroxiredoxin
MAMAVRRADVTWEGDLAHGTGRVRLESGAMQEFQVTWASRSEQPGGLTSPEELIAAAHGSCFSMALSNALAQSGHAPERLSVRATCTLDRVDGDLRITTMELDVRGRVPGVDEDAFRQAAEGAKSGCPVSKALANNLDIRVTAQLEQ